MDIYYVFLYICEVTSGIYNKNVINEHFYSKSSPSPVLTLFSPILTPFEYPPSGAIFTPNPCFSSFWPQNPFLALF
jgi:hypothetical protein